MTKCRCVGTLLSLSLVLACMVAPAAADVTYVSATRTVRAGNVNGPTVFTATDLAPFSRTVTGTVGFLSATATMNSTLNPTTIVTSGRASASGDRSGGIDFYGMARNEQTVNITLPAPANIWLEGGTVSSLGSAFRGWSAQFRSAAAGELPQSIPATPTLLPAGDYIIITDASANAGPSQGLYGEINYAITIHFDVPPPPICAPDYNHSGTLNVDDIFAFLSGWFAGEPAADFNHTGGLNVQDIFDFLNAWFAGCP